MANAAAEIHIRVARGSEADRAAEAFLRMPATAGESPGAAGLLQANPRNQIVALRGERIVGSCVWVPGAGRCATVVAPRLAEWDEEVASRLIRGAVRASAEAGARFIQAATEPEGRSALARAIGRAGMERLAVLAYLRRAVTAAEARAPEPKEIVWKRWTPWRRRQFARTIARTYEGSLDCPAMAGLRTAQDALATHRATGVFRAGAWHLALEGGEAVGVVLASEVEGRGDLVYLGVVPEARERGVGRALLGQAIRDTARMGLVTLTVAVDTENGPAWRLYAGAGFKEVRRRLVFFVPRERLSIADCGMRIAD
ncbi:MAG: GNAT family N-acetyltransferase [Planctomycetota bacterium]|nr:GNAT family N-acetyltransferase [Planctomycetota bacterium]